MKTDILIVGAGSTGLSTAISLKKISNEKVIVVEKDHVGSGQTGQCCGFIRTYYNSREMAYMAFESMNEIKRICNSSADLEYAKKGLLVFEDIKRSNDVKKNVRMLKSLGIRAKYLEGEEIKKVNPYLKSENACAGFDEDAGYANPQVTVNYLANSCREADVQIYENTKVLRIKREKSFFVVETNNGRFIADKILNATAAFTNNINSMLGFTLSVIPINIDNAFYRLPLGPNNYQLAIADFINCFYIIPHKDFIDVSSIALDLKRKVDPEEHIYNFNYSVVREYLSLISKRISGAEKSASIGGFNSCIDVTPDYYPILSEIDNVPNFYCATGFSGTGFKHFPMVGKIMAKLIVGKKSELASHFRYDRFKKGRTRKKVSDSYFVRE